MPTVYTESNKELSDSPEGRATRNQIQVTLHGSEVHTRVLVQYSTVCSKEAESHKNIFTVSGETFPASWTNRSHSERSQPSPAGRVNCQGPFYLRDTCLKGLVEVVHPRFGDHIRC